MTWKYNCKNEVFENHASSKRNCFESEVFLKWSFHRKSFIHVFSRESYSIFLYRKFYSEIDLYKFMQFGICLSIQPFQIRYFILQNVQISLQYQYVKNNQQTHHRVINLEDHNKNVFSLFQTWNSKQMYNAFILHGNELMHIDESGDSNVSFILIVTKEVSNGTASVYLVPAHSSGMGCFYMEKRQLSK